jgi:YgiT-type zinc finger domain-containing protein
MNCLACKHGELKAGRTTVTVERDGTTIVIRNVPAEVCETCGEDYLDSAVASSLETVLQEAARSGVRFELREYKAA